MVIIYPTVIQPLFNKLSPLAEGELRSRVEALASRLKFPLKHLYEIDGSKRSSHSNAYFFGLPWVGTVGFAHMFAIDSDNRVNTSSSLTRSSRKVSQRKSKQFLVSCSLHITPTFSSNYSSAHELGHWYYLHPTKLLLISQVHIFTVLAFFPAFLHAPPVLRAFDFPKAVAARPPTIIAFILFQVRVISASFDVCSI
jgi:STE24 endopeptidase